jgi:hypothetical protein
MTIPAGARHRALAVQLIPVLTGRAEPAAHVASLDTRVIDVVMVASPTTD